MKRTATTLAAGALASIAIALGAGTAAADPCQMPVPGGTAPCPPPIVSTSGDEIGGDANTDPVNMRDLPRLGGEYEYKAPSWEPTPDEETPDEGEETPADGE
ncbi:membrane protein [Gordonia phage Tardus]|uniref:Membrane protein n=1 Tax=Gordonia phage Tardus TaxID=2939734 RepID=A0A9E7E4M3_9CAUD|nr:membrane protein [Gordonia phage Tardus]